MPTALIRNDAFVHTADRRFGINHNPNRKSVTGSGCRLQYDDCGKKGNAGRDEGTARASRN